MNGVTSGVSFFEPAMLMLVPALPILMATLMLLRRLRGMIVWLAPWASLPALIVALVSFGATVKLPWLLLGAQLGVDDVGRVFLFLSGLLWLLAGIYGQTYLAADPRRERFFVFYLLTLSGNLGLIVAQDVLSFYLFFSFMSFSSFGLIAHYQDSDALRAGRVYLYLVVLGEVLLFAGLVTGARNAGTLSLEQFNLVPQSDAVIGLLLAGFGIKAGALPLHVWLALAHPVAPTPASAVLSGAMIKAGLLGWLRFLPLGQVALAEWGSVCVAAGLGGAIYGVFVGLLQDKPKTVLAYSSISQMGLMIFAVGIGMAVPEAWPVCLSAVLVYAVHHAFAKGALFLGAGMAAATDRGSTQRRLVTAGLLLPSLALAGLPLTSGAVAKIGLKSLTEFLPVPWSNWMTFILSLFAVGTTFLMSRFLYLVWTQSSAQPRHLPGLWRPWSGLLIAVVFFIWIWPEARPFVLQTRSVIQFWQALWPAATGLVGAWAMSNLIRRGVIKITLRIPTGDVLSVVQSIANRLGVVWSSSGHTCLLQWNDRASGWYRSIAGAIDLHNDWLLETWFRRWGICGTVFLSVLVLIFLLLALA